MPEKPQIRELFRASRSTPGGVMTIVFDSDQKIHAIDWEDHEERFLALLAQRDKRANRVTKLVTRDLPEPIGKALDAYFAGSKDAISQLSVEFDGTVFENMVWQALTSIPPGETRSYGEIARQIGKPSASRAVGAVNGRNPIGVLVPCHRVIGKNGSLTGYGGGLARKQWLLDHEGASQPT